MLISRFADFIHAMHWDCLAGVEALHRVQYAIRSALHRQVYVVAECGNSVDGFDDVASEVARMRCGEAHYANPRHFAHRGQQFRERFPSTRLPCRIFIRIHVLAEQLNFRVAEIGHLARFGEYRSDVRLRSCRA